MFSIDVATSAHVLCQRKRGKEEKKRIHVKQSLIYIKHSMRCYSQKNSMTWVEFQLTLRVHTHLLTVRMANLQTQGRKERKERKLRWGKDY